MTAFTPAQIEIITSYMRANVVPGAAVALVRDGSILAEGGFGIADLSTGRAPDEHTRWPIASVTKSFTAAAAMQLVEAGRLDLDAPINDYLPDLLVADRETTARLTMRRLLTHTSGLGRTGHQDRTREEAVNPYPTREALLAALTDVVPQARTGSAFSYSNESYAIAGRTIEVLRGKPLERCFVEDLFTPVGMQRSAVSFDVWRADPARAFLYAGAGIGPYGSGDRHDGYEVVELVGDYRTFLSTGGIVSTAHDLALYQMATMDYHDSALDLRGASLDHMHSTQVPYADSGWGYGLGYWVMFAGSTRVIGHSGGLPGVSTYSLMIPSEKTGVVVLTNRSDVKAFGLAERLANDLRGELWRSDPSEPLPIRTRWPSPDSSALEPYLGRYRFRRGPAEVLAGATGVTIRTPSRYDGPVHDIETRRIARDRFLNLADGHVIEFIRDGDDRVCGFLHSGYRYERDD